MERERVECDPENSRGEREKPRENPRKERETKTWQRV